MALLKAWKSVASIHGTSDRTPKKGRVSLLPGARRNPPMLDLELSQSANSFWTAPDIESPIPAIAPQIEEVTLERSFTLSILEGHKLAEATSAHSQRESTGTTETCVSGNELTRSVSLRTSPPPVPPRSRARSSSSSSGRSVSIETRRRKPSIKPPALSLPELEEAHTVESAHDQTHPPTYSSAACPTRAMTYRFGQTGPFGMTLAAEGEEKGVGLWRYHVGVGINVLTLRSWITSVRRGCEDGPLVAEIESGSSAGNCTVTVGETSRPSKDVLSRTVGSKMYYIGDGTSIRWKLGKSKWEAFFDSVVLATFDPGPARKLVVQPLGHRFFDHIVVAILLLMREEDQTGSPVEHADVLLPLHETR